MRIDGWFYQYLKETESTNDAVLAFFKTTQAPSIVRAEKQTKGRGRLGRIWAYEEGNFFASFIFEIKIEDLGVFSLISGLAVAQTISEFFPSNKVQIKWPNDVLVQEKKIGGILFEKGPGDYWVMGIGINVQKTPDISQTFYEATSLHQEGVSVTVDDVFQVFVQKFNHLKTEYEKIGFEPLKKEVLDRAYNRGKRIVVKQLKKEIEGIFEDIDDDGALLIETEHGKERILAGDIFKKEEK